MHRNRRSTTRISNTTSGQCIVRGMAATKAQQLGRKEEKKAAPETPRKTERKADRSVLPTQQKSAGSVSSAANKKRMRSFV